MDMETVKKCRRGKKQVLVLAGIIVMSLFFHLHHFQRVNFAGDQGAASRRAREIYQERELTLVGIPITSWEYEGKQAHISSLAYYLQIAFLLAGNWRPVIASAIFAIMAALMSIPLYDGLINLYDDKNKALVGTTIYALLPICIDYTSFLWNPNYQLMLLPVSIYFLGKARRNHYWLLPTGIMWGMMICLHYQFTIAISGAYLYLLIKKRWRETLMLASGTIIGLLPVIAMEINTHFYNMQIMWQILIHASARAEALPAYYFLVSGLLLIIFIGYIWQKQISNKVIIILLSILLIIDAVIYLPTPRQMWGNSADGWFYALEEKASEIITEQNLTNYNIVNLIYPDPMANVQKYLLSINDTGNEQKLSNDYYSNDYLFIMHSKDNNLSENINYEVNTFVPEATASWNLSEKYRLTLWKRTNK